jgi:hypothetical protein
MNTQKPQTLFISETPAPLWQDKNGVPRVSAASGQPSTAGKTALNTTGQATTSPQRKHSTKRKTVFAGAWIDLDTDSYIEHRKKQDKKLTRSKVIATMLRERAQDDAFARSQAILVPIIQQAIRSEFRAFATSFTNRFLALIARITYEVSQILYLLVSFLRLYLGEDQMTLHRLETQSETQARVNITRRTPQVEEVIGRLKHALGAEEGQ